jgi:hypothetical protein
VSDPRTIRSVAAGLRSHPPLLFGFGVALLVVTGAGAFAAAGSVRLGLAALVVVEAVALAAWLIARPRRGRSQDGRPDVTVRIGTLSELEDNDLFNTEGDPGPGGATTGELTTGPGSKVRRNRIGNQRRS